MPTASDALQRVARLFKILTEKGWVFPIAPLNAEDALALALMRGIVAAPGLPQADALRATLDKLTGSLPPWPQSCGRPHRCCNPAAPRATTPAHRSRS